MSSLIRLSKLMSERGLCSRREADRWIEKGWIYVEGQVVTQLGTRVSPDATITLSPDAQKEKQGQTTILLHKPLGYVSSPSDDGYPFVLDLIQNQNKDLQFSGRKLRPTDKNKLSPIGRLDIDSTGLMLLSQDGTLAKKVIGENSSVEKEYIVTTSEEASSVVIKKLCYGLSLDHQPLKPAKVELLKTGQLRFILTEGKKRQIRRMCEAVGLTVTKLKRVRIGTFSLGKLQKGRWRFVTPEELAKFSNSF